MSGESGLHNVKDDPKSGNTESISPKSNEGAKNMVSSKMSKIDMEAVWAQAEDEESQNILLIENPESPDFCTLSAPLGTTITPIEERKDPVRDKQSPTQANNAANIMDKGNESDDSVQCLSDPEEEEVEKVRLTSPTNSEEYDDEEEEEDYDEEEDEENISDICSSDEEYNMKVDRRHKDDDEYEKEKVRSRAMNHVIERVYKERNMEDESESESEEVQMRKINPLGQGTNSIKPQVNKKPGPKCSKIKNSPGKVKQYNNDPVDETSNPDDYHQQRIAQMREEYVFAHTEQEKSYAVMTPVVINTDKQDEEEADKNEQVAKMDTSNTHDEAKLVFLNAKQPSTIAVNGEQHRQNGGQDQSVKMTLAKNNISYEEYMKVDPNLSQSEELHEMQAELDVSCKKIESLTRTANKLDLEKQKLIQELKEVQRKLEKSEAEKSVVVKQVEKMKRDKATMEEKHQAECASLKEMIKELKKLESKAKQSETGVQTEAIETSCFKNLTLDASKPDDEPAQFATTSKILEALSAIASVTPGENSKKRKAEEAIGGPSKISHLRNFTADKEVAQKEPPKDIDGVKYYVYKGDREETRFLIQAQDTESKSQNNFARECGPYRIGNMEIRMSELNNTINLYGKEVVDKNEMPQLHPVSKYNSSKMLERKPDKKRERMNRDLVYYDRKQQTLSPIHEEYRYSRPEMDDFFMRRSRPGYSRSPCASHRRPHYCDHRNIPDEEYYDPISYRRWLQHMQKSHHYSHPMQQRDSSDEEEPRYHFRRNYDDEEEMDYWQSRKNSDWDHKMLGPFGNSKPEISEAPLNQGKPINLVASKNEKSKSDAAMKIQEKLSSILAGYADFTGKASGSSNSNMRQANN